MQYKEAALEKGRLLCFNKENSDFSLSNGFAPILKAPSDEGAVSEADWGRE